jgi:hypothetical protein
MADRFDNVLITEVTIQNKTVKLATPATIEISRFGGTYYIENSVYDLFRVGKDLDIQMERIKEDLIKKLDL